VRRWFWLGCRELLRRALCNSSEETLQPASSGHGVIVLGNSPYPGGYKNHAVRGDLFRLLYMTTVNRPTAGYQLAAGREHPLTLVDDRLDGRDVRVVRPPLGSKRMCANFETYTSSGTPYSNF
jgi:hypothetical protein